MANLCFFHLTVSCTTKKAARKLYVQLEKLKAAADAQHIAFSFNDSQYMFDTDLELDNRDVRLNGWVKWRFESEKVLALFDGIENVTGPASIHMTYEEYGCLLYGEYEREGELTMQTYLPEDKFPVLDDWDGYDEAVEAAYAEYAVSKGI